MKVQPHHFARLLFGWQSLGRVGYGFKRLGWGHPCVHDRDQKWQCFVHDSFWVFVNE